MQRVHVYIDGFNFYYGLKYGGFRRYYWLDHWLLAEGFLQEDQTLVGVSYFTAAVKKPVDSRRRQQIYLEALAAHRPAIAQVFGQYLAKFRRCTECQHGWEQHEEKKTDVNIACALLEGAFDDRWDVAIVVSGDSDLVPPVESVRRRHPEKRVIIGRPPERRSKQLDHAAHGTFAIGEDRLRACQLPPEIQKTDGYTLRRPAEWA